jgi:hypothetical protein
LRLDVDLRLPLEDARAPFEERLPPDLLDDERPLALVDPLPPLDELLPRLDGELLPRLDDELFPRLDDELFPRLDDELLLRLDGELLLRLDDEPLRRLEDERLRFTSPSSISPRHAPDSSSSNSM